MLISYTLDLLTHLKIAHWEATSKNAHEVYGSLRSSLENQLDQLVEVSISLNRVSVSSELHAYAFKYDSHDIKQFLHQYLDILDEYEVQLSNSFILNIINDMQLTIRKSLYLLDMI